jgi:hypothetical protein
MSLLSPEFESRLNSLCPAYLRFLAEHETDIFISDLVMLYGRGSIEERNTTNEVAEYLPDFVSIGNDSGDYEFLMRRDGSEVVVWEDPGAFSAPSLDTIHLSFGRWLSQGCPLPEEPKCPIPTRGRIWLITAPNDGMKDMFALRKLLSLDCSIPEMKKYLNHLPSLLIDRGTPYSVHRRLSKQKAFRVLLGFSAPGTEVIHRYIDFDPNDGMPLSPEL